ncbi:MAG: L-alanine exporter AlaE, partial [Candidatus Nanoarchaeia archaeon]
MESLERKTNRKTNLFGRLKDMYTSKKFWIDTIATYLYFQPIKPITELYIGGADFQEYLAARGIGFATNIAISYPLIILSRQWDKHIWKINEKSSWRKRRAADASLALPLSALVYAGVLTGSGFEGEEIAKAVPANLLITIPYA